MKMKKKKKEEEEEEEEEEEITAMFGAPPPTYVSNDPKNTLKNEAIEMKTKKIRYMGEIIKQQQSREGLPEPYV